MLPLEDGDHGEAAGEEEGQQGGDRPRLAEEGHKGPTINAKHRRVAHDWWQSQPEAMLVTMRLVMEPLRKLMQKHIDLSGDA